MCYINEPFEQNTSVFDIVYLITIPVVYTAPIMFDGKHITQYFIHK